MKYWNLQVYCNLESQIASLRDKVSSLDLRVEQGEILAEELDYRKKFVSDSWSLLWLKDVQLFQRSRVKWINEGDENTSFFHAYIKSRSRRNGILTLKVDDTLVEEVSEIHQKVVAFFSNHFREPLIDQRMLYGVFFPSISEANYVSLTAPFSSLRLIRRLLYVMGTRVLVRWV